MFKAVGSITDRDFIAIISVGMVLRLLWGAIVPVEPVSDAAAYDALAKTLAQHGVYGWTPAEPTAFWAVGTSALVAATYLAGANGYGGVVALNLVAAFMSMVLVWRLGEIWFDRATALCATAIIAFWPNLIFFTSIISSELFFIALTLLGIWLWERSEGNRKFNVALCGLVFGLACFIRPVILLLPIVMVIASVPRGRAQIARASLNAFVVTLIMLLVVSPWTYRNTQVIGSSALVSTNFGPTLWMGNNPETQGVYMSPPAWAERLSEVERSVALGQAAKEHILSDVPGFVLRTLRKAWILHSGETIGVTWNAAAIERGLGPNGVTALKILSTGYWFAVLAMALGAIIVLARRDVVRVIFHPAVLSWGYFVAIPAVLVADQRYHMPATPFIALLAAVLLAMIVRSEPIQSSLASLFRRQSGSASS